MWDGYGKKKESSWVKLFKTKGADLRQKATNKGEHTTTDLWLNRIEQKIKRRS